MGDVSSVVHALDRLTDAVLQSGGSLFLPITNLIVSFGSAAAAILSYRTSTRAVKASERQSDAADVALSLSARATEEQTKSERHTRTISTVLHCQTAYKAVESVRLSGRFSEDTSLIKDGEIGSFFRNFWTLKSDQFDYWLSGYVDHDTFLTWTVSTARHFASSSDRPFFVETFTSGWANYGRPYHKQINPLFVRFTDTICNIFDTSKGLSKTDVYTILDIMEEIDKRNVVRDDNGEIISRRLGAPQEIEKYRKDLKELHENIRDLFENYWGDGYDFERYGISLKSDNPAIRPNAI